MSTRGQEKEDVDYEEEYYDEGGEGGEEQEEEGEGGDDVDAEEMMRRMNEMDDELAQITKVQSGIQKQQTVGDLDENSVYVGQVDYEATMEELRAFFSPCGTINKLTIVCDKISKHPKGYAYIEFVEKDSVTSALLLDDSTFKGRQLKVLPKKQSVAGGGYAGGRGGGRGYSGGRGYAGRGGGYAGRGGGRYSSPYGGGRGRGGYRGGGGRGRGRGDDGGYAGGY